jgi:hypothetical protein
MTNISTFPYTLEVQPSDRPSGTYEWTIRRHGKLVQRSDRPHHSEADARKNGEREIERQFKSDQSPR